MDLKFKISEGEEGGAVGFGEFLPLSGGKNWREVEVADADTDEAEGREVDGCGHFSHLAVASFAQGDFDPTGRDVLAEPDRWIARGKVGIDLFGFGGKGFASFDNHTGAQLLQS